MYVFEGEAGIKGEVDVLNCSLDLSKCFVCWEYIIACARWLDYVRLRHVKIGRFDDDYVGSGHTRVSLVSTIRVG